MASKRRNMFCENKKQEMTEIGFPEVRPHPAEDRSPFPAASEGRPGVAQENESSDMNVVLRLPIFKENVCRLCAIGIQDSKLFPIFDRGFNEIGIRIKEILPALDIKLDDLKPQQICADCLDKLNICRKFLYCCIESDFKFDSYIQQCQDQEEDNILKTTLGSDLGTGDAVLLGTDDCSTQGGEAEDGGTPSSVGSRQDYVVMVQLKYTDSGDNRNCEGNSSGSEETAVLADLGSGRSLSKDMQTVVVGPQVVTIDSVEGVTPRTILVTEGGTSREVENETAPLVVPAKNANPTNPKNSLEKSSGSNSFECPHCLRRFGRRSRLTSHIAVAHSSDRPLACAMCDARVATRGALRSHVRTCHTREFQCPPPCGRAFPSLDKLARHARTHTGEKPFACAQCPKAFADKRNLENHVRTHTGERPYACAVCSKAFAVRSHATDHARRVHHRTPEYFQCEHCSKRYRWKNKYRRHLKTSHPDRVATAESSK